MATKVTSSCRYYATLGRLRLDLRSVLTTLLRVFADHASPAVQTSNWLFGEAILAEHPAVGRISIALANLRQRPVDLAPFGMTNDKEVYVATGEPHGLIEATVERA